MLRSALIATFVLAAATATAQAADYTLEIKDHKFEPATLEVAAGEKHTLIVRNRDKSVEEFESHELKREKLVPGGREVKIPIGPLEPGEYPFYGEFHEDTAQGKVVAR